MASEPAPTADLTNRNASKIAHAIWNGCGQFLIPMPAWLAALPEGAFPFLPYGEVRQAMLPDAYGSWCPKCGVWVKSDYVRRQTCDAKGKPAAYTWHCSRCAGLVAAYSRAEYLAFSDRVTRATLQFPDILPKSADESPAAALDRRTRFVVATFQIFAKTPAVAPGVAGGDPGQKPAEPVEKPA